MALKLGEAIEHLNDMAQPENAHLTQRDVDALMLGVEALKRIASGRNPDQKYVCYLLRNETPPTTGD